MKLILVTTLALSACSSPPPDLQARAQQRMEERCERLAQWQPVDEDECKERNRRWMSNTPTSQSS